MAHLDPAIVNDSFARRLALVYAAFFLAVGWHLPLFPVWLAARGLDPAAIGIVLAAMQAVRVVAHAGRTRASPTAMARCSGAIVVAALATVVAIALLGSASGFPFDPRRGRDARVRLRAGHAADRRLCAARVWPARPRLRSGAAVGLGRVHRGEPHRRRAARHSRARPSDLADLCRQLLRSRSPPCCSCRCRATMRTARARRGPQPSAPAGVPRHRGGRQPHPGKPRGLLRLLDARLDPPRASTASPSACCGRSASPPRSCCSHSRARLPTADRPGDADR